MIIFSYLFHSYLETFLGVNVDKSQIMENYCLSRYPNAILTSKLWQVLEIFSGISLFAYREGISSDVAAELLLLFALVYED